MSMGKSREYKIAIRIAGEMQKSLPDSVKYTKRELRAIARDAAFASKTMKSDLRGSLADTTRGLEGVNKIGSSAFRALAQSAKMAAAATIAVAGASVKVGTDFENQMSTVKAISGATGTDFEMLSKKAKEMGATTSFTAKESGEAMEYMAMAGWKTQDMLSGIGGIMDLAAGSGESLATTSDIVTDALTAFRLQAKDSTHFADVLAKASSSSNTNVAMMGETFKYVGATAGALKYSIEDTAVSIGLMANSGIKASMAGTQTRKLMSELAGGVTLSSKAFAKAGEKVGKLHIATSNADGSMKPWSETVNNLREAFSKMTDKEKAANAEAIGGKTAMTGLLAIVNASEKDYKKLTSEINNANGAAKKMADTRLDNLKGDVTLFTSAMQGAGIEIYEELNEPLRDLVQEGTKWVGDFSESFSTKLPTVIRKVEDAGEAFGDFAEPFLTVGEWLLDNPDVLIGTIAGIGTALATYKVATGVMNLAESFLSLGTGAKVLLGAGAVIGVVSGIGTAMAVSAEKAKQANLDAHFGDIALSIDEIDSAARHVVGNGYLARVEELLSAKEDTANVFESLKDDFSEIEKYNWKIEAEIGLKKGELKDYKKSCKDYVKNAQDYINSQGYTVSVATKVLFGKNEDDNAITNRNNTWYKDLNEQVEDLSSELNEVLDKKLKKSFTIKDKEAKANQILKDIAEITQRVSDAEDAASWDLLDAKWSGKDLDADSFLNMQKDIDKYTEEAMQGADEAYQSTMKPLREQLAAGKYTDENGKEHVYTEEMFQKDEAVAREAYYSKQTDAVMNGYNFMMGKVKEKYGDEINPALEGLRNTIQDKMADLGPDAVGTEEYFAEIHDAATNYVKDSGLSSDAKAALGELLKNIEPSIEKMNKIKSQAEEQGITLNNETQGNITSANREVDTIGALLYNPKLFKGDNKHDKNVLQVVGEEIGDNQKAVQKLDDWVGHQGWKEPLLKGIENHKKDVNKEIEEAYDFAKKTFSKPINISLDWRYSGLPTLTPPTLFTTEGTSSSKKKKKKKKKFGIGGLATSPTDAVVAEQGDWEMMIPINSSSRSFDLWKQTGDLLGVDYQVNGGVSTNIPKLSEQKVSFSNLISQINQVLNNQTQKNKSSEGYSPVEISYSPHIVVQGKADKETMQTVLQDDYSKFEKMMKRYIKNGGRVSLKGG